MTALLECKGVDVSYGPVQILFGVDFEVAEGEIVALLGTNGAGKSTLLKAICGLGEAEGAAPSPSTARTSRSLPADVTTHRGISLMPGGKGVFPTLTVAENLRLASWLIRDRQGPHRRGPGRGRGAVPDPQAAVGPDGRQPVRRRAADARPRRRAHDPPEAAHDRRAVARPGADDRRAAARGRPRDPPPRHDDRDRRAVDQRRPAARPAGGVHGEGRGPLRRPDRRAARAPRHPPLGVHRRRRRRRAGRAGGQAARRDPRAGARRRGRRRSCSSAATS